MDSSYKTRPFRRLQTERDEDFYDEQQYHAPYLHQNCQQCDNILLKSINEGMLENESELLNVLNGAYFNEESVNSFDIYRHFHPLYNFNHNPYQNSFSLVALPNKRQIKTLQTGDFILMRLVLSGKTFQAIIINPEWFTNEQITGSFSNSSKPGYYVQAYGNTGGNWNENVFLRIADKNNITPGNIVILRKLLPDNFANNTDLSFPETIQFAPAQEDQQEYFTEGNEYENDPSVPNLISRDTTPALETLYVSIDLGLRKECVRKKSPEYKCIESLKFNVEPKTGIFIPATFTARSQVDLLIYLHGHKSGFVSHGRDLPIDSFWDAAKKPKFAFREIVNASGRNLILVAPTLGPLSQAGNLTSSEGFTSFVSKVLASLSSYCSLYFGQQTPAVKSIILAAHSGGGEPMRRIAKLTGTNEFANLIKECWGFDCTYSSNDPPEWYNWANTNPDKSLYLFSIPGTSTAHNAALIQKGKSSLANIHLTASSTGDHNSVPKVYMAERLAAITTLTESYDESDNEDCGCDCEEDNNQFSTESSENILTEQSAKANPVTPDPIKLKNIPFAPPPAARSYWPVRTSNRLGRLVSYLTVNKTTIGREGRRFLARRDNRDYNGSIRRYTGTKQNRWHVGIDLFANIGDEVVACEAGKIINLQYFYKAKSGQRTFGVIVEHAGCVINYGEVIGDSLTRNKLQEGDNVVAGQVIGFVSDTGMLHFETYSLREDHKYHNLQWWMLPETPNPPTDLLNPTQYLLHLRQNGLPAAATCIHEMISEADDFGQPDITDATFESETESFNLPEGYFELNDGISEDLTYTTHPQLRSEARGSEVIYLQQRLNYHDTANDNRIKEDGIFGPETQKAILSFQNKKGLAADGIVGAKTWAALDADRSVTPGSYPPEVPPDYYTPPIFPPEIIPVDFIPPVVPVTAPVEQVEWTVNPNINARYKTWQAYKAIRDQVVRWGVTNAATYIESAILEWNSNTSIHGHFDRNFDGDPHRSYLNLKRLYQAKGIADPASYFNTNIVSITFFNRTTSGHRNLQTALNTAQTNLTAAGHTFTLDRGTWSFVPRTFNANINRLSNHALGKAIDINPANNPHITSADEILVIDAVCSTILTDGLLREANPNVLINASIHFQQTFNDAWVAQQTQPRLLSAIKKKRAKLNEYAIHGFLNLPVTLIAGLQSADLNWGGSWSSAKDFMHFELPNS